MKPYHIEGTTVNHNTSSYTELMLRSLFVRHSPPPDISITIYDNASTDDMTILRAYAGSKNIPIIQTGFPIKTKNNSHGEILKKLVLAKPDCTHYLFLDPDVCFLEENILYSLLDELENNPDAFGIGPRLSWDGVEEIPDHIRNNNPGIYVARLHPCCALIRNTRVFRSVVKEVGFSCIKYLWANDEEYFDTFKLMTKVMRTHGFKHIISSRMILHFTCTSYFWQPIEYLRAGKERRRDVMLAELRSREG